MANGFSKIYSRNEKKGNQSSVENLVGFFFSQGVVVCLADNQKYF
jgi:hypothetical protein